MFKKIGQKIKAIDLFNDRALKAAHDKLITKDYSICHLGNQILSYKKKCEGLQKKYDKEMGCALNDIQELKNMNYLLQKTVDRKKGSDEEIKKLKQSEGSLRFSIIDAEETLKECLERLEDAQK